MKIDDRVLTTEGTGTVVASHLTVVSEGPILRVELDTGSFVKLNTVLLVLS